MKKIVGSLFLFSVMLSCGSNDNSGTADTTPTATETPAATTPPTDTAQTTAAPADAAADTPGGGAQLGMELISKSDCATCHKPDVKVVGPAFKEVAERYKDDKEAVAKLADKIINGGAGNWGQTPMPPHPQISQEDASAMVQYILQVK